MFCFCNIHHYLVDTRKKPTSNVSGGVSGNENKCEWRGGRVGKTVIYFRVWEGVGGKQTIGPWSPANLTVTRTY